MRPALIFWHFVFDDPTVAQALAQFLLDPYFRTIEGFQVLVEKEFCAFGHMFRERGGFGRDGETGPIFLQFLDAIAQILNHHPREAEFNDHLLKFLWRAAYSRLFANFLHNNDSDRSRNAQRPVSVWKAIDHDRLKFTNVLYHARRKSDYTPMEVLEPKTALQSLTLWAIYLPESSVSKRGAILDRTVLDLERKLQAAQAQLAALSLPGNQNHDTAAAADADGDTADNEDAPQDQAPSR